MQTILLNYLKIENLLSIPRKFSFLLLDLLSILDQPSRQNERRTPGRIVQRTSKKTNKRGGRKRKRIARKKKITAEDITIAKR